MQFIESVKEQQTCLQQSFNLIADIDMKNKKLDYNYVMALEYQPATIDVINCTFRFGESKTKPLNIHYLFDSLFSLKSEKSL